MIKILLISDTHGRLDIINDLVKKTKADLVIHAGDFGFYDESSYKHISAVSYDYLFHIPIIGKIIMLINKLIVKL